MKRILLATLLCLLANAAIAAFFQGAVNGPATIAVPTITTTTLSSTEPATNGQVVGTVAATNSPTSFAISSCSGCASYFAISSSGVLTVTATGASNITATTYNPQINATNGGGTGPTAGVAVTFTALSACPYGTTFSDGCAGAVSATRQQANYFTSYALGNGQNYISDTFTGVVASGILTVSADTNSSIIGGGTKANTLLGTGVPAGTIIAAYGTSGTSGTGGNGTYQLLTGGVNATWSQSSEAMQTLVRPPWNVAGVEYAVGVQSSASPVAITSASLPGGVSLSNTNHLLTITGANVTLSNIDFSASNGYGWEASSAASGTLTFVNCIFGNGSNLQTGIYATQPLMEVDSGSAVNVLFSYTSMDLAAQSGGGLILPDTFKNFGTGTVSIQYSNWQNIPGRFYYAQGQYTNKDSWMENINFTNATHGEWMIFNAGPNPSFTQAGVDIEFVTFTQGTTYGGGMTAPLYLSSGVATNPQVTFTNSVIKNNVDVVNGYSVTLNSKSGSTINITATNNQLTSGEKICEGPTTCNASLGSQVSGTTGGTGVWNFTGTIGIASGTIYLSTVSPAPFISLQQNIYQTLDVEANFIDPRGSSTLYNATTNVAIEGTGTSGPSPLTNSNNINMNLNVPATFVLRRDLDPASNDNTPMWLNKAA